MFKKSKFALLAFAGLVLAGCGVSSEPPTSSGPGSSAAPTEKRITLTVWSSLEDLALQEDLAAEFADLYSYDAESNTNYTFKFFFGDVYVDAQKLITQDISTAADVFVLPDDQVQVLKNAGALAPFRGTFADDIRDNYVSSAVGAATLDGEIYGYPYTADNGYFLYYNSNFLTLEDVATMDGLTAKLATLGKKMVFDLKNGYYIASFFTAGGTLTYDSVNKVQVCDFDNATGLNNARGFDKLAKDYIQASSVILPSGLTGELAGFDTRGGLVPTNIAGVSGTWDAANLKTYLGDGYAATKLPTFTPYNAEGVAQPQVQLGSFAGSKIMATKIQDDPEKLFFAQLLAQFLNSAENQVTRYELQNYGPGHKAALTNAAVITDVALQALALQSTYAIVQARAAGGKFWDPLAAFGTAVCEQDFGTGGDLGTALTEAVTAITA